MALHSFSSVSNRNVELETNGSVTSSQDCNKLKNPFFVSEVGINVASHQTLIVFSTVPEVWKTIHLRQYPKQRLCGDAGVNYKQQRFIIHSRMLFSHTKGALTC